MTEQNPNPASTDDVEGHWRRSEPDRMEGWGASLPEDDTQGHVRAREAQDADDTEGHIRREAQDVEDDDTVGHGRMREAQDVEDGQRNMSRIKADDEDDAQGHARHS
jgi:hypothetical protein